MYKKVKWEFIRPRWGSVSLKEYDDCILVGCYDEKQGVGFIVKFSKNLSMPRDAKSVEDLKIPVTFLGSREDMKKMESPDSIMFNENLVEDPCEALFSYVFPVVTAAFLSVVLWPRQLYGAMGENLLVFLTLPE